MIASRHNSDGKKAMVRLLDKVVGHFAHKIVYYIIHYGLLLTWIHLKIYDGR